MESLDQPGGRQFPAVMRHSRPKRILIACAAVLVLAGLVIYFFTRPAATLSAIRDAAASKNFAALNELVDFPSLRASVTAGLVRDVETRVAPYTSAGARIGALLGSVVIGPMVELVVSPLGLVFVLQGYTPKETVSNAGSPEHDASKTAGKISYATRWESLSQYAVEIRRDEKPVSTLRLRRDGVFAWKLASIDWRPANEPNGIRP